MQYCSFRHQTSLLPPDTSTNEQHICFGPAASFFLELLVIALCSSSVSYYASSDLGGSSSHVISSLPFHTVHWVLEARILRWFAIPVLYLSLYLYTSSISSVSLENSDSYTNQSGSTGAFHQQVSLQCTQSDS